MADTFQSVTGGQPGQREAAIRDPRRKFLSKALGASHLRRQQLFQAGCLGRTSVIIINSFCIHI